MKSASQGKETLQLIFSHLYFVLAHIKKWDLSIFLTIGFYSLFLAISPFIWIIAPKLLIDQLVGESSIRSLIIILMGALLLSGTAQYFMAYLIGTYRMKMSNIRFKFIEMINNKAMEMDYRYTEDPEILNSIQLAWRTVGSPYEGIGGILQKLFTVLGGLLGFFGYITIVMSLHPWILLLLLLNVALTFYLTLKTKSYERAQQDILSEAERKSLYINRTMSDFQYGKDIRLYGLKSLLVKKRQESDERRIAIHQDIQNKIFRGAAVDSFLLFLRESIVYTYLIFRALSGTLSIGDFTLYASAISGFAGWMNNLMMDIASIGINCLYVSDLRGFLDLPHELTNDRFRSIPRETPYEICFENVGFQYPHSDRMIFKNLSFKIGKGQRLALVGINGAGKTTLVKLLTRLYQPTEGRVLLNGINIQEFDQLEYFKLFSVVFQDIKMFAFNVAENVAFEEKFDLNRVWGAIEQAGMGDKILSMKNGLHTSVLKVLDDEGVEFSGGENQKLAFARSLYKNGEIVVLDEPTAALDPLAEYQMYRSFNEIIGGRTALFISHRLSSTRFCDQIAFFENGQIKEWGTHQELMEKGGKYARMFEIQAQYYREEDQAQRAGSPTMEVKP